MIRRFLAGCALLVSCLSVSAAEPDWPQWRGPKRDSVSTETGLLKEWPKGGPQLLWKAEKIGGGFSSVSIAGERIFTIGNKGGKSHLVCLARKDGKQLWTAEVGRAGGSLGCTPTIDGGHVYAIGQDGDLFCADVEKGEVKWRRHFKKDFKGNCGGWQYTESPLIDGDRLICTPGAKDALLAALDKKTGETIWTCKTDLKDATAGYSSIVIAEAGGIKMYVQLVADGVVGVDAKSGKQLWKYDRFAGNTANIPTPVVLGNQVFCCAGYGQGGGLLTLSVDDGKVTAKQDYFVRDLQNKHGGVVVVDGKVFGDTDDSGSPHCADVKTGKVIWRKRVRSDGSGSAAVTYANGRLYFQYDNGYVALVDAEAKDYKEVGGFTIPNVQGNSWAHPVVLGGKLYLRQNETVLCYDIKAK